LSDAFRVVNSRQGATIRLTDRRRLHYYGSIMNVKSQALLDRVREAILNGEFVPGKNMTQGDMAARFRVSRTPIREILRHLEYEGLITSRRKNGISFRSFTEKDVIDVYDLRELVEGHAVRQAAEKFSAGMAHELEALARTYVEERGKGNRIAAGQADERFHEKLLEFSGNRFLHDTAQRMRVFSRSFRTVDPSLLKRTDFNPHSHAEVIAALRSRDPRKAERAIVAHIEWAKQHVLKWMRKQETGKKGKSRKA
jgi:DNA-binding GntR family transcriptional regulator